MLCDHPGFGRVVRFLDGFFTGFCFISIVGAVDVVEAGDVVVVYRFYGVTLDDHGGGLALTARATIGGRVWLVLAVSHSEVILLFLPIWICRS